MISNKSIIMVYVSYLYFHIFVAKKFNHKCKNDLINTLDTYILYHTIPLSVDIKLL